ncbi:MAG: pantoate kinase [Nitrososphaerales archaeon]
MESAAYSPAHVTGLVQAYEYPDDPINTGSKGIGFSIQGGVTTHAKATPSTSSEIYIDINGRPAADAPVSEHVAKTFIAKTGRNHKVFIKHKVDTPIGVGFGTSGAAALSLALALNDALELGLSRIEAAQVAHLAEVACRTGLGTVLAEMQGGFEARVKPGAPGFGRVVAIPVTGDYVMGALVLGPLSTGGMLREIRRKEEAAALGERLLDLFLADRSVESFLNLSNRFSQVLGLSPRLQGILKEARDAGFVCGVALFGETVFTLIKPSEVEDLKQIFMKHTVNGSSILVSRMEDRGARLL